MAIIWMDGFDHYGGDKSNMLDGAWGDVGVGSSDFSLSAVNPRTGSYSMLWVSTASPGTDVRRILGGAKTTVGFGAAINLSDLPAFQDRFRIISFNDATNTVNLSVVVQTTGIITVKRGEPETGTDLGSSDSAVIIPGGYQHFEVLATFDNSAGEVEVRVDGVTVISLTSVDTVAGLAECSQIELGNHTSGVGITGVSNFYMDDVYCYDTTGAYNNDFIGDRRVLTLFPSADTAQNDFDFISGSAGWENIDDISPDGDTSYIFANAGISPNPVSEYELDDLPVEVTTVSAVYLTSKAKKTDVGDAYMQQGVVSGASETLGDNRPVSSTYVYYSDVVEADPDTGSAFTPTGVNNMKLKIERTQ